LMDRGITPYMPTRDAVGRTRSPFVKGGVKGDHWGGAKGDQ
jgi:hypothetical protein